MERWSARSVCRLFPPPLRAVDIPNDPLLPRQGVNATRRFVMVTFSKIRTYNPECYEVKQDGTPVGRIEVRWGFCRAWYRDQEVYKVYNHIFWRGFGSYIEKQTHLSAIKKVFEQISLQPQEINA